jgi:hypothetical protein
MANTKCPYARAQARECDPPGFALAQFLALIRLLAWEESDKSGIMVESSRSFGIWEAE